MGVPGAITCGHRSNTLWRLESLWEAAEGSAAGGKSAHQLLCVRLSLEPGLGALAPTGGDRRACWFCPWGLWVGHRARDSRDYCTETPGLCWCGFWEQSTDFAVFQVERQDLKGKSTESASSLPSGHPGPRRLRLDTISSSHLARLHWLSYVLPYCSP